VTDFKNARSKPEINNKECRITLHLVGYIQRNI